MKRFQKSLGLLDSIISKIERNYGITAEAGNHLDDEMKLKYSAASTKQETPSQAQPQPTPSESPQQKTPQEPKAPKQPKGEPKGDQKKDRKPEEKKPVSPDAELIDIFRNGELRVGLIEKAEPVADSEKLYVSKVFMGTHHRTILSGLRKHISPAGMSGKVIVFCNLKPRPLAGQVSEGMIMCSENQEETIVELLRPGPDAQVGDLVELLGVEGSTADEYKPPNSKKVSAFLEKLNTSETKQARFGDKILGIRGQALAVTGVAGGKIK